MKKCIFLLFFLLFPIANATVYTQVDPPKVQLGETFSLTLSVENTQKLGIPDLTGLQQNFTIMGTERSMSYTMVNGQSHSISRWIILLSPKRIGTLTIPAISIGNEKSNPTSIEVTEGAATVEPSTQAAQAEDVLLKTEVTPKDVFVNQEILYTVKLYNKQNLLDAVYQPPRVENALMVPLEQGKRYQTVEKGETYLVEEEKYAIFPQKSGILEIIPPAFHALIYDFTPRKVNLKGEAFQISVKPIPTTAKSKHWFPAKEVKLTEQYDQNTTNLLQGSTLIRNITITAIGTPAQLMPNLDFGNAKGFKVYPEKPATETTTIQSQIVGISKIKLTYLFNTPGDITLPEVKIPWFNTITGKEELAFLPARTVHIDAKGANPIVTTPPSMKKEPLTTKPYPDKQVKPQTLESSLPLAWIIAIAFAVAWIATLILWWRKPKSTSGLDKRQILKRLHDACERNDPLETQTALLQWANVQWPKARILNLNDVSRQVMDQPFKKEIHLLSEAIYSQEKKRVWVGQSLWQNVQNYRKRKQTKMKKKDLPPINPV